MRRLVPDPVHRTDSHHLIHVSSQVRVLCLAPAQGNPLHSERWDQMCTHLWNQKPSITLWSLLTSPRTQKASAVVPRPPGDYILLTLIHSAQEYVVISQIHRMANCHDPTTTATAAWKCLHWQYVPSVNYDYAIIILEWASCSRYTYVSLEMFRPLDLV